MMTIEKLKPEHLTELAVTVQPMQYDFGDMLLERGHGFYRDVVQGGPCIAFLDGARVLGVAGLVGFPGTGRSTLWCAYAENIAYKFACMFKLGLSLLLSEDWRRVEAYIDPRFVASKRFARLAGFEYEGIMRKFWTDGTDRELWARVR